MVEPVSIALISGAAGVGLALGRLSKGTKNKQQNISDKEPVYSYQASNLQFLAIEGLVNPQDIIDRAIVHKQVFLNVKKILGAPDKLFKLLHRVQELADENNLVLTQISKDIFLITSSKNSIQVNTPETIAEADLYDKFVKNSIAGY